MEVIELWEGRSVPLQLNGASGLKKKIAVKYTFWICCIKGHNNEVTRL